jgi:hypothetical protein
VIYLIFALKIFKSKKGKKIQIFTPHQQTQADKCNGDYKVSKRRQKWWLAG